MPGHVISHVAGHMMGQTQFGHVTFPRSRASEVPESRFMTPSLLTHFSSIQPQLLRVSLAFLFSLLFLLIFALPAP